MVRARPDPLAAALRTDGLDPALPAMSKAIRIPDQDAVLYQDSAQGVDIRGQSAGLPPELDRVYLTLFSAPPQLVSLQPEVDERLRLELQEYGLRLVNRISYAQAIINGEIRSLSLNRAETVTNLTDALFYSLILQVNVQIVQGSEPRFLEPREIREQLLVIDTNRFTSNIVVPLLLQWGTEHLAEAVIYGWQQNYAGATEMEYRILESTNESSLLTNRP